MARPSQTNAQTGERTEILNNPTLFNMINHLKRSEHHEFLRICDTAYRFAAKNQTAPLLGFILSNITDNASAQLQDKTIESWDDLKSILKQLFSGKRTDPQLLEDLNTLTQKRR